MKILHILSSSDLNGAENIVIDIITMFNSEIEMCYMSLPGKIQTELVSRDIQFLPLKSMSVREVTSGIKKYKPDIIHAHDKIATILSVISNQKVPIISHLHGNNLNMRHIGKASIAFLVASLKVKKVLIVSMTIFDGFIFRRAIKKKTVLLENFIDLDKIRKMQFLDKNDYAIDLVYLGRLGEPKNPMRLARVATCVLKNNRKLKFGLIGDGSMRDEMNQYFSDQGVIDQVTFYGHVSNPYKILSQAKVMLMCSRFEGLPLAALEALYFGIPIVSTPTDGLVNLIKNGFNGYLSDDDSILSSKILELFNDHEQYSIMRKYILENSESTKTNKKNYKAKMFHIYQDISSESFDSNLTMNNDYN